MARRPVVAISLVGGLLAVSVVLGRLAVGHAYGPLAGTTTPLTAAIVLLGVIAVACFALDRDPTVRALAAAGAGLKLLGGAARKGAFPFIYPGSPDADFYDYAARRTLELREAGVADPSVLFGNRGEGTQVIITAVTELYEIIGPNQATGFAVFALVSWFGLAAFYRAGVNGIPGLDRRRYAALVFLLPSLWFWPSSVGKEAWMITFLGLGALGASHLLGPRFRIRGVPFLAGGLAGAAVVRPHLAVIAALALAGALAWPSSPMRGLQRLLVIGFAAVALTLAVGAVRDFFGMDRFTGTSGTEGLATVDDVLEQVKERTAQGGSEFDPVPATTPAAFPMALFTVLFRPVPLLDTSGEAQLVAAAEAALLMVLLAASWRRLARIPALVLRHAYLRFALVYTAAFTIAFSYIANFGILTRQRTQVLPLVLLLLALPLRRDRSTRAPAVTAAETYPRAQVVPAGPPPPGRPG